MANPISGLQPFHEAAFQQRVTNPPQPAESDPQLSFQNLLLDGLSQVNGMEHAAQSAIEQSLTGGDITNVEVFTAVKKAELSLSMMLEIRNKLLEAYDEIKQMQL